MRKHYFIRFITLLGGVVQWRMEKIRAQ